MLTCVSLFIRYMGDVEVKVAPEDESCSIPLLFEADVTACLAI